MHRRQPYTMKVLACIACTSHIKRVCRWVMEETPTSRTSRPLLRTHLNQVKWHFQQLSDYYSQVHGDLQQIIGTDVLRYLDDLIARVEHKTYYIKDEFSTLCLLLMRSVMFKSISIMNVEAMISRHAKEASILSIYRLEGLLFLRLPMDSTFAAFNSTVAESIKYLPLLKHFFNPLNCTDVIIGELTKNCSQIELINVRLSTHVTDNSVLGILKLNNLKLIDLYGTSVSDDRYKLILQFQNDLRNFCWQKGASKIIREVGHDRLRNIVYCDIFVSCQATLNTIQERCPKINTLVLNTNFLPELAPITKLNFLTQLRLQEIDCQLINITYIFQQLWQKLEVLSFKSVFLLRVSDIVLHCANLYSLEIENCLLSMGGLINADSASMHFQSLNELILVNNSECPRYYNSLHRYKNLREVYFEKIQHFNDTYFEMMFRRGGFRSLQRFMVRNCGDLGINTALTLLGHCPRLMELGCLRNWVDISSRDIARIVRTIRRNNYAVTVTHWFMRPHYFD